MCFGTLSKDVYLPCKLLLVADVTLMMASLMLAARVLYSSAYECLSLEMFFALISLLLALREPGNCTVGLRDSCKVVWLRATCWA